MTFELSRRYQFEAAHWLPRVPKDHQCSRLHGHTYSVEIRVRGPEDLAMGWVFDYAELDHAAVPAIHELDHRLLNDVSGLENPTSEHVARWLWERLANALPGLHSICIAENSDSSCTYWGAR